MKQKIDWSKHKEAVTTAIIAAQPGWFVIDLVSEDLGVPLHEIWKLPIVAWKIMDNAWAEPILVADAWVDNYYLLSPDGAVHEPMVADWKTVQDFIDYRNGKITSA